MNPYRYLIFAMMMALPAVLFLGFSSMPMSFYIVYIDWLNSLWQLHHGNGFWMLIITMMLVLPPVIIISSIGVLGFSLAFSLLEHLRRFLRQHRLRIRVT